MELPELNILMGRWETFIEKMTLRYVELTDQSLEMAQEILENNRGTKTLHDEEYIRFHSMIENQLRDIVKKSEQVWDQQINPLRGENNEIDAKIESYCNGDMDQLFQNLHDQFIEKFETLYSKYHNPYQEQQYIIEQYKQHTANLCCTQCGANLEIQTLYIIPTYVTCPACSTQNTFTPPSVAFMMQPTVQRIAQIETADLRKKYEKAYSDRVTLRGDNYEGIKAAYRVENQTFLDYINAFFDKEIELLPILKDKFNSEREMRITTKKRDYQYEF